MTDNQGRKEGREGGGPVSEWPRTLNQIYWEMLRPNPRWDRSTQVVPASLLDQALEERDTARELGERDVENVRLACGHRLTDLEARLTVMARLAKRYKEALERWVRERELLKEGVPDYVRQAIARTALNPEEE